MAITTPQAATILKEWGANESQVSKILPQNSDEASLLERVSHIDAIHQCLLLLYRDDKQRNSYMLDKDRSGLFSGQRPLEIIASGELKDLAWVHGQIRRLVCI